MMWVFLVIGTLFAAMMIFWGKRAGIAYTRQDTHELLYTITAGLAWLIMSMTCFIVAILFMLHD